MGSGPKTKAECDREIAIWEGHVAHQKAAVAAAKPGPYKEQLRYTLAQHQEQLAKYKALRKTLK